MKPAGAVVRLDETFPAPKIYREAGLVLAFEVNPDPTEGILPSIQLAPLSCQIRAV